MRPECRVSGVPGLPEVPGAPGGRGVPGVPGVPGGATPRVTAVGCVSSRTLGMAMALLCVPTVMAQSTKDPLGDLAERYVKLVLAVGLHDRDYVDAYYGQIGRAHV